MCIEDGKRLIIMDDQGSKNSIVTTEAYLAIVAFVVCGVVPFLRMGRIFGPLVAFLGILLLVRILIGTGAFVR
jgi:hypothetical protein